MVIENIMYFALGFIASGLLGLMILPSVWQRAVRLTKKRIEAATPMTMSEFRADKDQLRAEFALSTRRLEKNVEAMRNRVAEQLGDINRKKSDLSLLKSERDQQLSVIRELEERESELRRRILDLEKEGADLAQRLRMRDREFADKVAEFERLRDKRPEAPIDQPVDGSHLTGDYVEDIADLLSTLSVERERSQLLEQQSRELIIQLESAGQESSDTAKAVDELRRALAEREDRFDSANGELADAEARMAHAESRLNALLEDTHHAVMDEETRTEQLLAEKLSLEEELEALREKVLGVETAVSTDWERDRMEQSHLRERLNDIASDVSRLVYAVDGDVSEEAEESLFDKVQRFADDGSAAENLPVNGKGATLRASKGRNRDVSDRMEALRDIQGR
jgi:chromosome segregation ATPase